jgi:DNA-binding response OmpR family regulator/HPt (histidine-containing phosphotransfer) domain-containing protein
MDSAIEHQPSGQSPALNGSTPAADVNQVLRDTRQQFSSAFASHCATLRGFANQLGSSPSIADEAIQLLHRIAGLAGTIGFPLVGVKAAALEDALRDSGLTSSGLLDGVAALEEIFAGEVNAPGAPAAAPEPFGAAMTVLVVEDEPFQRTLLAAQLRKAGHKSVEVGRGEEVLDAARQARPDVILLDVELPGINGYAVCRMLKADPTLATIPIAFLSAHGHLDDRLTGLSFGADDFLTKPIDPRELALRLQRLQKRAERPDDRSGRGVLTYEAFCEEATRELGRDRCALALIRTPADRAPDVAAFTRDEIRRRDLCGQYDRSHVVALLPDTGPAAARDRIASIVETCRANGITSVFAGISGSPNAGSRTLEQLLEEADEALAIARYEGLAAALRPEGPRGDVAAKRTSALVVVGDDDPDVVRIVDAHLAAEGYRRALTFDGIRTLEEVRAQRPDVLVLDLMMPRMTGFDVLAGLRDMGEARPRVIVLSARGREDDVIRAFSLGADDFVSKPFNPQELLARIARLLK